MEGWGSISVGTRFYTPVWASIGAHPPPSSAEVKERGQVYLYSSSGPPWLG